MKNEIHDYIINSSDKIFLTNTIFNVFEKELRKEGVENKYYLQGIIKEEFGDELYTRRDYISKDKELTSIHEVIVNYVKNSKYPVSKEEIKTKFPGITEIVLNMALNDYETLNLFGKYINVNRLNISQDEFEFIKQTVVNVCSDNRIHHVKDVFYLIKDSNSDLLERNFIKYPFDLYSLLEWLFYDDDYQFSRPYIGNRTCNMVKPIDALNEIIEKTNEISIREILTILREGYIYVQRILELLVSFNKTHFLKNNKILIKIDNIGFSKDSYLHLEKLFEEEVTQTMPISNLKCVYKFPKILIPWDEWLIFSMVYKWSDKFEVAPSSNEFRYSVPLISPMGKMDTEYKLDKDAVGTIIETDDLSNIDELIGDYITDEIEGAWDYEF